MNRVISPERHRSNARLAWLLGSIAVLLFVGFIVKSALFGI